MFSFSTPLILARPPGWRDVWRWRSVQAFKMEAPGGESWRYPCGTGLRSRRPKPVHSTRAVRPRRRWYEAPFAAACARCGDQNAIAAVGGCRTVRGGGGGRPPGRLGLWGLCVAGPHGFGAVNGGGGCLEVAAADEVAAAHRLTQCRWSRGNGRSHVIPGAHEVRRRSWGRASSLGCRRR